ncbi:hypothetical protein RM550_14695 [Streptomyces sp. DSM 41527]|uniref:Uncharacterized protein n=1 Tax=Streptomyces mooreae TaxID=3075523 RepID=A0ABU2T7G5_9ACTN|nr:hypothetical protein [Streptomyces sp. DSM 41527]MDT0456970.1 hypothetical protein [Streptomyces sp. DSM 41527]
MATGLIGYSLFILFIWHEPLMLQLHKAGLPPAGQPGFPAKILSRW